MADYGDLTLERALHFLRWRDQQLELSRKMWIRAAEAALTGDLGPLRNRVALSREPVEFNEQSPPPLSGEGSVGTQPIDIILFCPRCGLQHIDAPDERTPDWKNPPHKSHLCHGCGFVFRPADVPTNGVADIKTIGANDGPRYRNRVTLTAQEVTDGWQGMESAPRNGSAILIYQPWKSGRETICIGHYANGWVNQMCLYCAHDQHKEFGYELGNEVTEIGNEHCQPTHWRPLPAPPESALRTGEDR